MADADTPNDSPPDIPSGQTAETPARPRTYLSGVQPTGLLHLGNYFGAIRQHLAMADEPGNEAFYFIADYHALTTIKDAEQLRTYVREVAVTYMALGLDMDRACFFRQSEVPEVLELAWMLGSLTGMGLLERAHSYKDKTAKGLTPNVGLFYYPVLMAADILAYDATHVPVGKDQVQHVEMTQDMAGYFNNTYRQALVRPEPLIPDRVDMAKVPGLDGQKMSKSYGNTLWIFETGKRLKKAINRIETDSREPHEPKNPDELLLFDFLALFCEGEELADWRDRVRAGGEGAPGYGDLKKRVIAGIEDTFAQARARREELLQDPAEVDRLLAAGAARARERAAATLDRCRSACGLR